MRAAIEVDGNGHASIAGAWLERASINAEAVIHSS
jgi:hypothetical protein